MRRFHDPVGILKNVVSPVKPQTVIVGQDTRSPAQDAKAEQDAAAEAARKARAAAALQTGSAASLLTPTTPASSISTRKKTLLGSV